MAKDTLIEMKTSTYYTAIAHIRLEQRMTEGEDLLPGGACAAVLEAELFGGNPHQPGKRAEIFP